MTPTEKFKKDLLLLLFKHNAKLETIYNWDGSAELWATVGLEEIELPKKIDAHTKII
jgi:hypothetical protein